MDNDNADFINPITGAPVQDDGHFANSIHIPSIDFGEFHDTTADVHPNNLLNATCGNLSKKYVSFIYNLRLK